MTTLGEVLRIRHGFAFAGDQFSEDEALPTIVTPGNFRIGGGFQQSRPKTFAGTVPDDFVLHPGDLIITMTDLSKSADTLGSPALVPNDRVYLHNQRIGLADITEPRRVSREYLLYRLRMSDYRQHVIGSASGTTVRHTSPGRIESFRISLPHLSTQRAIAEVLGALDDKIAANGVLEASLDGLGLALYQAKVSDVFESARIGDIATVVLGGTPSRSKSEYWTNGDVAWIASGEANKRRVIAPTEWITREALAGSAAKLMPRCATAIAITGATLGQITRLEISTSGNQSLVGVWSDDPALNDWIYFSLLESTEMLVRGATGAAQQHINKQTVFAHEIRLPDRATLRQWGARARLLLDRAALAARESVQLAELRDTLLPHLMSGRITVREAEKAVEEVL